MVQMFAQFCIITQHYVRTYVLLQAYVIYILFI